MIEAIDTKDNLNKFLLMAILLHLALVVISLMMKLVMGFSFFDNQNTKEVEVVQAAVRVDIVGMPKFTLQELKKMDLKQGRVEKESQNEKPANETSDIEFKKKGKKLNIGNLLNSYSAKKVKTKKIEKKKYNKAALKELILEGNQVSKGLSATGENQQKIQKEFVSYLQILPDKVRTFWKLPSYLLEKELQCRIQIYINKDGQVIKTNILESSGDVAYDKKALEAIKNASPLPRPSEDILKQVTSGAIVLGFPL